MNFKVNMILQLNEQPKWLKKNLKKSRLEWESNPDFCDD